VHLSGTLAGVARANSAEGSLLDPRPLFADMHEGDVHYLSRVFRIRMEADGRYVKVYMDEKRIANIPNADFGRANKIFFEYETPTADAYPLIGNISVNAGGKKLYDALLADGRVSTQGILFDIGSDRIRGESTPTLKQIGDMLTEHPDLKLAVEGHTDNTGTPASNLTLSQKRAQAIVNYLTTTFSVSASRLTPEGMGQTKPVKPNDTVEGRQANRRVELVKK
jgi:OOP family OmpA-OmpF porin